MPIKIYPSIDEYVSSLWGSIVNLIDTHNEQVEFVFSGTETEIDFLYYKLKDLAFSFGYVISGISQKNNRYIAYVMSPKNMPIHGQPRLLLQTSIKNKGGIKNGF